MLKVEMNLMSSVRPWEHSVAELHGSIMVGICVVISVLLSVV